MFACCDDKDDYDLCQSEQTVDIHESVENLTMLMRLLHHPPETFPTSESKLGHSSDGAIPLPLLPPLLDLADKYLLTEDITSVLHTHVLAHAEKHPLQVFALANSHNLKHVALQASTFLLNLPPVERWSLEDVRLLGNAETYHRLNVLQHERQERLRELVLKEDVFPHGYGRCIAHADATQKLWDSKRSFLALRLHAGAHTAFRVSGILHQWLIDLDQELTFPKKWRP
ncbi:hypothetical protein SISNIDRAFT_75698 [Sistotremastrum niveocremeum HHB9708]|uniref:Uncharacterized protein n=1 Tax=Sistotremastrum niveocremeum HHB9708 TaxID=1314777 RepID=A0A164UIY3_9AGAM|nr:hypothetical protein SISNIDRAFT_75698 [Sistotremastrum niveocremeum HHB9708]